MGGRHEGRREMANSTAELRQASKCVQTRLIVRWTSDEQLQWQCLLGHRRMTKKGAEHVHKVWLGNWSARSYHREEQRRQLECAMSASKCPTPVVRASVCSKHFCRDFESAGDTSLLRLRPANWRWSHCSWRHVKPKDVAHNWPPVFLTWAAPQSPQHSGHTLP